MAVCGCVGELKYSKTGTHTQVVSHVGGPLDIYNREDGISLFGLQFTIFARFVACFDLSGQLLLAEGGGRRRGPHGRRCTSRGDVEVEAEVEERRQHTVEKAAAIEAEASIRSRGED